MVFHIQGEDLRVGNRTSGLRIIMSIDIKEAKLRLVRGLYTKGYSIDDSRVVSDLNNIGAFRFPIAGKWYWLFADEGTKKIGIGIIKKWLNQNPGGGLQKGWGKLPAVPDSRGKYLKSCMEILKTARELLTEENHEYRQ